MTSIRVVPSPKRNGAHIQSSRCFVPPQADRIEPGLARRIADPLREATALSNLVLVHKDEGDGAAAIATAREAIAADTALDNPWGVAISQSNLIFLLLRGEGPARAYEHLADIAERVVALGDIELSIVVIEASACVWAGLGDPGRAARLLGSAEGCRQKVGIPRSASDQRDIDRFIEPALGSLSKAEWQHEYTQGQELSLEAAVVEALSGGTGPRPGSPARSAPTLTQETFPHRLPRGRAQPSRGTVLPAEGGRARAAV